VVNNDGMRVFNDYIHSEKAIRCSPQACVVRYSLGMGMACLHEAMVASMGIALGGDVFGRLMKCSVIFKRQPQFTPL
jgi:hypothetical protein